MRPQCRGPPIERAPRDDDGQHGVGWRYLIADTRERAIHPLLPGCIQSQINTGDYLVCERVGLGAPRVLACVERKTYSDLAASIRDNRYANLASMLDLRERTGCQLFLLLEGPAAPSDKHRFGGLPWAMLDAVVMDLVVQNGMKVLTAGDAAGSAKRLLALLQAFERAPAGAAGGGRPAQLPLAPLLPWARPDPAGANARDAGQIPAGLRRRLPRSAENAAIAMWARLRGVSAILGRILIRVCSLSELALKDVDPARIRALRTATGRPISKDALAGLLGVWNGTWEYALRVVSGARGLTVETAAVVLRHFQGLAGLCRASVAELAAVYLPDEAGPVPLGKKRAAELFAMLHYRAVEPQAPRASIPTGAVPVEVDPSAAPAAGPSTAPGSAPRGPAAAAGAATLTDEEVLSLLGLGG